MAIVTEKRRDPRTTCDVAVMLCRDLARTRFEPARILDRSDRGIRLETSEELRPGEAFLLKMRDSALRVLLYRSVHCNSSSDGNFQIGAEFLRAVGEHE